MECNKCGKQMKATAKICLSCGSRVNEVAPLTSSQESSVLPGHVPADAVSREAAEKSPLYSETDHSTSGSAVSLGSNVDALNVEPQPTMLVAAPQESSGTPQFESASGDIFIKGSASAGTGNVTAPSMPTKKNSGLNLVDMPKGTKLSLFAGVAILIVSVGLFSAFSVKEGSSDKAIEKPYDSSSAQAPTAATTPMALGGSTNVAFSRNDLNALLQLSASNDWTGVTERVSSFNAKSSISENVSRGDNEQGIRAIRDGNFEGAISHFQKAVAANPNTAEFLNNLGFSYLKVGRLDEARNALLNTLLLDPTRGICWFNVSELFSIQGNLEGAQAAMRLAIFFATDQQKAVGSIERVIQGSDGQAIRSVWDSVKPTLSSIGKYDRTSR